MMNNQGKYNQSSGQNTI